jgi:hypothetical protein
MSIDWDEMAMEAHLFPWLDSDCMADPTEEEFPFNVYEDECEDSDEG